MLGLTPGMRIGFRTVPANQANPLAPDFIRVSVYRGDGSRRASEAGGIVLAEIFRGRRGAC